MANRQIEIPYHPQHLAYKLLFTLGSANVSMLAAGADEDGTLYREQFMMQKRISKMLVAAVGTLFVFSTAAQAKEAGDWVFRLGVASVNPKSDNGDVVSVDSGTTLAFNGTYMFSQNVGLEVLASLPFSHDIKLEGTGTIVGETKQLPPTVSLQYHFVNNSAFTPYAGLGVNYTLFFDEKTKGPLAGSKLDLDASFGVATQLGIDYDISDNMHLNFDLRWMDIDTDAKLDGVSLGTVEIDPLIYSVTVGWKF